MMHLFMFLCIDADKQDAINLFLGNFVSEDGQPMLWELNSDYHLHNQDPRLQPLVKSKL